MIDANAFQQLIQIARLNLDLSAHWRRMDVERYRAQELATPRYADPKRLVRHGFKVYSQADEDGIIQEIFKRIGAANRSFIEFGVETGIECNSVKLLVEGWSGLWIEAFAPSAAEIRNRFGTFLADGKLRLSQNLITAENINAVFESCGMTGEVDLLSIDIDGNDYWVWKAIEVINPRLVVIEYNATLRPPMALVVPYRAEARWDGSNHYGASLEALVRLAAAKNYRLVGCSIAGVNAFFVRADLTGDKFLAPATAQEHYEPPRHYFHMLPSGHRSRPGPFEPV